MRDLRALNAYRTPDGDITVFGMWGDETFGTFIVPSPIDKAVMVVIATTEKGWDHVSVSRKNRVPNWAEMEHVFRLFFAEDEAAMQLHVPQADHINCHPNVLHLWRSQTTPIPRPPSIMV